MTRNNIDSPLWYHQPWAWFVFGLPAIVVVAGIATLIIAINNKDSLVNDNYYKEGLAINQSLEQDQFAQTLSLKSNIRIDNITGEIFVGLTGKLSELPQSLTIQFVHTTNSNKDQTIALIARANKQYYGLLNEPLIGRWRLIIEPDSKEWRLYKTITLPTEKDIIISTPP